MKSKITILSILLLALLLTACGSASASPTAAPVIATQAPVDSNPTTPAQPNDTASTQGPRPGNGGTLSVQSQLLIGTYKLEDTAQAITAQQAAVLLPLWQSLNTALTSSTQDATQIESLTTQIQAAMTAEQLQAITDMNLTRDSVMTFMQEQGITMNGPQNGNGQQGNMPQGTPPAGGPGGNGNGQPPSGQMGTPPAGGMGFNFLPPDVMNAFLQLLQNRASASS